MATAARFLSSARLARPSFAASVARQSRGYASAAGAGGPNYGLIFSLAGVTGLGAYAYLQYNPAAKAEISAKAHELEAKAEQKIKGVQSEVDAADQGTGSYAALIKDSWTPFTLTKVAPYNHNSAIYTFSFGEDGKDKVSGAEVASALLVRSPQGEGEIKDDKGKPVIRPYTPVSSNEQKGSIDLLIKEYKDGKLTPFISSLQPGQQLLFKGPILKFKYEPNSFDRGLAVAGGSGITPMYQLVTHSLNIPDDKTKWTLVFSNVTENDILLRKEWDELAKQHPDRLEVKYVLDKGPWGWKGETGFVTPAMISKLFPRSSDSNEKIRAFVCGPPPQVKSLAGPKDGPRQGELQGAFKELGYTADEVFKF
ncbi:uncharacterized protein L199_001049 [Kwoniella botswanensis]|uniref:uncharacterized protein n=1 Tax=Kwoniella botswanensis TaxID=1268659 RepID=UPI00315D1E61